MTKTTKIILWSVCIAICAVIISLGAVYIANGALGLPVVGDGNVVDTTYAYNVSDITIKRITVSNLTPDVNFVKSDSDRIVITTDSNIAEEISVNYNDEEVTVSGKFLSVYTATELTITVYYVNLEEVNLSGRLDVNLDNLTSSADIDISGSITLSAVNCNTRQLSFEISGSCQAAICGTIGELDIDSSGSSEITLCGNIDKLEIDITGSGEYIGSNLVCNNAEITCSGSGKVTLSGSCGTVAINASGSMNLDAQHFISRTVTIRCSGSTIAKVNAQEILNVTLSGSCNITYFGNPRLTQNSSGSCTITHGE